MTFTSQNTLEALPLPCLLFPGCNLFLAVINTKASKLDVTSQQLTKSTVALLTDHVNKAHANRVV